MNEFQNDPRLYSASLRLFWQAGTYACALSRSILMRLDFVSALRDLLSKDTLSFRVRLVLLRGAAVVFLATVKLLEQDVSTCLQFLSAAKKSKSLTGRYSLLSLIANPQSKPPVIHFTPIDLSQYQVFQSEEVMRQKHAVRPEHIDLLENNHQKREERSAHSSINFQNDFEIVLNSDLASVHISPAGAPLDPGTIDPLLTPRHQEQLEKAKVSTTKKKPKRVVDKACCVSAAFLKGCVSNSADIITWRFKSPPNPPGILCKSLQSALEVYLIAEHPVHAPADTAPNISIQPEFLSHEYFSNSPLDQESFIAIEDDLGLLPEPVLEGTEGNVEFETPKVDVTPPLAELLLPTDVVFSFEDAKRDNPGLKPASLFLRLLELVQTGDVDLEQSAPFAPLVIRQRLGL